MFGWKKEKGKDKPTLYIFPSPALSSPFRPQSRLFEPSSIFTSTLTSLLQGVIDEVCGLAEVGSDVEAGHVHRGDAHELEVAQLGVVGRVGAHVAAVSMVVRALSGVQDVCDAVVLNLLRGQCRVAVRVQGNVVRIVVSDGVDRWWLAMVVW